MKNHHHNTCVIGWPVSHSKSPLIHNTWIKHYGLKGEYRMEAVEPEKLTDFIKNLPEKGYCGANITLPHKEQALALVDEITPTARAIGAVNTLYFKENRLIGDNSDAYGFLQNLEEATPHWSEQTKSALIIGAGGAARAVIYALQQKGIKHIVLANRTLERAQSMADFFGNTITVCSLSEIIHYASDMDLIINALSIEAPLPELQWSLFKPHAIATDLSCVPLQTPFLAKAHQHGLKTINGLGMLLHQAVVGFEHWFGQKPDVDQALRKLIEQSLAR